MGTKGRQTTLPELIELWRRVSKKEFLRSHQDPLFLAMGVLDTEEIRARCGSTTEMAVKKPVSHNPKVPHPLAGRVYFIPVSEEPSGSLVFGRDDQADIVIPDDTVSGRHCVVTWGDGEVSIKDLGSTNGTLVNLRPVRRDRATELLNEDIVTVGRHSFQFYLPRHLYRVLEGLAAPPFEGH